MQPDHETNSAKRIAVVIATYNERSNIERLIPDLMETSVSPHVVIVDDSSPDGTGEAVRECMERFPGRISLVERSGKLGYGSAVVAGFQKILDEDFDVVVTMDADFSHDPAAVPDLIASLDEADLAIGSRYVGGIRILNWSMSRLLLSSCANFYVNTILRYHISDCTSGFRAYRTEVLHSIDLERASSRGYSFLVELLELVLRAGFSVHEVPIVYTERCAGKSKMSRGVIAEAVIRPWFLLARRLTGKR
jgi:dolichol-phosphate mannosyltransferase